MDDSHPPRSATTVTKELRKLFHVIIRGLQYFLPLIQGFNNFITIPPRQETTPWSSMAHAQRVGAKTPVEPSSKHQNTQQLNRHNCRKKLKKQGKVLNLLHQKKP